MPGPVIQQGLALASGGGISEIVVQKITATGTYTPTAGMLFCIVEVVGGGAGGQRVTDDTDDAAGGGGAGGHSIKLIDAATIGASQSVTIGAGGAFNSAGGTTSFGAIMSATGGAAGADDDLYGTAGGMGSGGDINVRGMPGQDGVDTGGLKSGGDGGWSPYGDYGVGSNTSADGDAAGGYGAGGAGGFAGTTTNRNGGAGAPGVVIITEFVG